MASTNPAGEEIPYKLNLLEMVNLPPKTYLQTDYIRSKTYGFGFSLSTWVPASNDIRPLVQLGEPRKYNLEADTIVLSGTMQGQKLAWSRAYRHSFSTNFKQDKVNTNIF